jgi:hypothetical protein
LQGPGNNRRLHRTIECYQLPKDRSHSFQQSRRLATPTTTLPGHRTKSRYPLVSSGFRDLRFGGLVDTGRARVTPYFRSTTTTAVAKDTTARKETSARLRLLVLLAGRGNLLATRLCYALLFSASRQRNHAPPRYLGSTPALLIPRLKHGPSKGRSKDCAAPPTRDGSKRYPFLRSATSPGQQAAHPLGHHPITTTQPRPPPESPDYSQSHNKRMLVHSSVI